MTIRELMTGGLITVRPETSVQEARDLLAKENIRHLPVLGPGGVLAGIVTDRDIRLNLPSRATSLAAQEITHLLSKLPVAEIMTRPVITIGPDRPARDGAQLMLAHRIGALPVLDDGHLIGIITETDIVRAFVRTTTPARRATF
ncbi:MAG: CBS domain-containing protein [Candidatus Rokuibacteriota bacterium]|jgi:acetoin utilization protein AcuB